MRPSGERHFEPFLHLVEVGDDEALIAWGGFYFVREETDGRWRLLDDEELPGSRREETIGLRSAPYGEAVVEVLRDGEVVAGETTNERNHAWLKGLEPDTLYEYRVTSTGSDGRAASCSTGTSTSRRSWRPVAATTPASGRCRPRTRRLR